MNDTSAGIIAVFIMVCLVAMGIAFGYGIWGSELKTLKESCIQQGYAEYNSKTGDWYLIQNPEISQPE